MLPVERTNHAMIVLDVLTVERLSRGPVELSVRTLSEFAVRKRPTAALQDGASSAVVHRTPRMSFSTHGLIAITMIPSAIAIPPMMPK
ncbi:hypothetical protein FB385_1298 [Paramicrobacterium agarici]|nr:hypothetical protein FB385_1298 [Microbacterium agarici]